jgi:hypothetical protein
MVGLLVLSSEFEKVEQPFNAAGTVKIRNGTKAI